jgi:acyl dehydratase
MNGANTNAAGHLDTGECRNRRSWFEYVYTRRDAALFGLAIGLDVAAILCARDARTSDAHPMFVCVPMHQVFVGLLSARGVGLESIVHRRTSLRVYRKIRREGVLRSRGYLHATRGVGLMGEATGCVDVYGGGLLVAQSTFTVVCRDHRFERDGGTWPTHRRLVPPSRKADHSLAVPTGVNQAVLYSLTGDENPIHLNDEAARRAGFPRPILHGMCLWGTLCQVASSVLGCSADALSCTAIEFKQPVFPGATLLLDIWIADSSKALCMRAAASDAPHKILALAEIDYREQMESEHVGQV